MDFVRGFGRLLATIIGLPFRVVRFVLRDLRCTLRRAWARGGVGFLGILFLVVFLAQGFDMAVFYTADMFDHGLQGHAMSTLRGLGDDFPIVPMGLLAVFSAYVYAQAKKVRKYLPGG